MTKIAMENRHFDRKILYINGSFSTGMLVDRRVAWFKNDDHGMIIGQYWDNYEIISWKINGFNLTKAINRSICNVGF